MPTYDYECTDCGRKFEVFQSITAKLLRKIKTDCAKCKNQAPVKRLIGTGAAVLFKGNGFYQTDYRSEAYKNAAKADKGDGSKADSGSKKSDDKSLPSTDSGAAKGGGSKETSPSKSTTEGTKPD